MDPLAVIADIHGNADALDAVLSDIAARGVRRIVALGDHLSGPLAARECADLLVARQITCIRGNHDRYLTEQAPEDMIPSDRVAFDQIGPHHMDWLRGLPPTLHLPEGIFLCHGTPESDTTYWLDTLGPGGEAQLRTRAEIEALAVVPASLTLCAHTHFPRRVDLPDGRVILNPGSVGCPGYTDDHPVPHVMEAATPAACYAIVEPRATGWASSFHHVPYDTTRMVAFARQHGRETWARAIGTGWVR
ncbi:MAG: metallophosphoesterase [Rhodobacteraceae bacterium]|nr:metallophosphoesterase [Paracoccaceae bacterium]